MNRNMYLCLLLIICSYNLVTAKNNNKERLTKEYLLDEFSNASQKTIVELLSYFKRVIVISTSDKNRCFLSPIDKSNKIGAFQHFCTLYSKPCIYVDEQIETRVNLKRNNLLHYFFIDIVLLQIIQSIQYNIDT